METIKARRQFFSNRDLLTLFLPLIIEQAKYYKKKVRRIIHVGFIISSFVVLLLMPMIMNGIIKKICGQNLGRFSNILEGRSPC
jgi:hypothetical protein